MRLSKVSIAGFKSFADPIEIRFDQPKVGIVGPNGCGKSNIVDAIKWVLGERSAKSLRGQAMSDVIFSGSAGRKPLGAASVTLTFENPITNPNVEGSLRSDVRFPSTPRRWTWDGRLFRDGRSDYLLNGQTCRLRDIKRVVHGHRHRCQRVFHHRAGQGQCHAHQQSRSNEGPSSRKRPASRSSRPGRSRPPASSNGPKSISYAFGNSSQARNVACASSAARPSRHDASGNSTSSTATLRRELVLDQYHDLRTRLAGLTSRLADLDIQRRELERTHARTRCCPAGTARLTRHELQNQLAGLPAAATGAPGFDHPRLPETGDDRSATHRRQGTAG